MRLWLAISLILNLLLLGAVVRRGSKQQPVEFARPLRTEATQATRATNFLSRRSPAAPIAATPWGAIESHDHKQLVANLRAIGCPEQTIRDIVVTRLSREFQARLQLAHDEAARQRPWWRGTPDSGQSLELSQLRSALRRERDDLLEETFGESAYRLVFNVLGERGRVAVGREYLPSDKRQSLRELERRYAQLNAEITYPLGEPLDEEERVALEDLQRRKRSEIEYVLTPQELEELDLRESAAAKYVRNRLPEAQTEAEFRAMVLAAREAGVQERITTRLMSLTGRYGLDTPNDLQELREEERRKAIEARIKELLGEQRFAEMQQAEAERQAAEQARWEAERNAPKR
jgi:hypothetical protein